MKNPFVFGQIVKGSEFCSRQELTQVQKSIDQAKSVYLVGRHKMGKTSLVHNLKLTDKYLIEIDLKSARKKEDLLSLIVKALLKVEQSHQTTPDFSVLFQKFNQFNPTVALVNNQMAFTINPSSSGSLVVEEVFKLISPLQGKTPVLFFDNIQQGHKVNKDLMTEILKASKKHLNIFVESLDVFSGGLKFDELVAKNTYIELSPLDNLKYFSFVTEKLTAQNRVLSREMFDLALDLVGELSADRQMFFNHLYALPGIEVKVEQLDLVMKSLVDQYAELYEVIWEDLTLKQQSLLTKLALDPEAKVYSKQFGSELDIQNTNTVIKIIQSLVKKHLLYKKGSAHQLFSPFFRKWLNS